MWLDGLYMASLFLTQYAKVFKKNSIFGMMTPRLLARVLCWLWSLIN